MKYMDKIGMTALSCAMLGIVSCSDFSDYNTVAGESDGGAGMSLWKNIQGNTNLSKFAEIIKKAEFDSNLDSPRFYTVFAPKDGTYNADSVLELDDAVILKEFVKQHIVEYNHPVNSSIEEGTKLLSLNSKGHIFTSQSYGDAKYSNEVNIPASNGVLHILNHNEGFYNNIYEYFEKIEGCDLFRDYVQKYDEEYIDEANSIEGSLVHGEKTYEYIEYAHRNNVINKLMRAELDNEDSLYTVLFPNDVAWGKSYDRIKKNYKFLSKLTYMNFEGVAFPATVGASIQATVGSKDYSLPYKVEEYSDSLTKYQMVRNLAFSHGYDCNDILLKGNGTVADTLYSRVGNHLVSAADVEEHTMENRKMSNGYIRVVDSIPFQPWQTFEPIILSRKIGRSVASSSDIQSMDKSSLIEERDTIFKYVPEFIYKIMIGTSPTANEKFQYVRTTNLSASSSAPELDFELQNVLSTKYHIYVVTVPSHITGPQATPKQYYLRFFLNYTNENNEQKKVELKLNPDSNPEWGVNSVTTSQKVGKVTTYTTHVTTPGGYVSVIDLGEFEFPVSYYGMEAYPNLMMCPTMSFSKTANKNLYEQYMRVAGVYLIPVEADTYYKEKYSGMHQVKGKESN